MERVRAARIVGVDLASTPEQVRDAYRRRSRELHPDTGRGDTAAMAELNDAYETLRARAGSGWEFVGSSEPEPAWTDAGFDEIAIDDTPIDDTPIHGDSSPLRPFAIAAAIISAVFTLVVFVAAVGYDWSLSP